MTEHSEGREPVTTNPSAEEACLAIGWAVRTSDPEFDDWDTFAAWLEEAPDRSERYDAAVISLAEADRILAAAPRTIARPVPVAPVADRKARRWAGPAIAAVLAGGIGLGLWSERSLPYAVEAPIGQTRVVHLADGSELLLSGGTRIRLDRADIRTATLERGTTLFRIRHDARNPFRVQVGDLALTDLGTVFDIRHRDGETRVAVAEGAVMVDPDGVALRLDPGQAIRARGDQIEREAINPEAVGEWRDGRLSFNDVPFADVARDLSDYLGIKIVASPAIARTRYRGTVEARGLDRDPVALGEILDVNVSVRHDRWMLEPHR